MSNPETPEVSFIMPCFNEEEVIEYTVPRFLKAFAGADPADYRAQTIRACEPGGGESPDTGIEIRKLH